MTYGEPIGYAMKEVTNTRFNDYYIPVTTGEGGALILAKAGEVLAAEFPALAASIQLRTPDEKDKRHGQAVAAASLPARQTAKR